MPTEGSQCYNGSDWQWKDIVSEVSRKTSSIILMFFFVCSLLDILAGRKGKAGIGGVVLVNGDRQPKNFKCMSGYVVQVCPGKDVVVALCRPAIHLDFLSL